MSKIEWTEQTWNPIVGCSIVSPGCTNCYAMKMAARLEAMARAELRKPIAGPAITTYPKESEIALAHYLGITKSVNGSSIWTGKLNRAAERTLFEPLRRNKPTMYFVNSMSDLFHEDVPDEWIDRVFAVMALCPQHTFQVLTKRSARMRAYLDKCPDSLVSHWLAASPPRPANPDVRWKWPLQNVWLGVSAERQKEANERVPDLLSTPAAVRFVSAEPLLGPIDFYNGDPDPRLAGTVAGKGVHLGGWWKRNDPKGMPSRPGIDWVIVGGESGQGARAMHLDWARSIRDQCKAADVAFFFKQFGNHEPIVAAADMRDHLIHSGDKDDLRDANRRCEIVWPDGQRVRPPASFDWWEKQDFDCEDGVESEMTGCPVVMRDVGKKLAGRLLDGREHNEMPAQRVMEAA